MKKKIDIQNYNKYIIKNKSPKNKGQCLTKLFSKKELKSNKQTTKKNDYFVKEKKSPSKMNLYDDKKTKNNIIKKEPKPKTKKRQNKFFKKKLKEHEPSSLNSNLNIYKIIHSKDQKSKKLGQQSSSITTDSMNSYISNQSNKKNNNKCISLFNKSDDCNSFNRKRIDSEISNNSNKKCFYIKNQNTNEKNENKNNSKNISNKNKINNIKNSNKDLNQNKKTSMLSYKSIRNINPKKSNKNNNSDLPDFEFKTDVKVKGINSNIIFNKSEYNLINIKKNNNNNRIPNNKNYKKISKVNNNKEKEDKNSINTNENMKKITNDKNYDKDKDKNRNNIKSENILNDNNNIINEEKYCLRLKIDINDDNNNKINIQNEKHSEIFKKKNLNPVKKSLFTEHMNFLINHKDELKINQNNNYYGINNNNFINIPFNSLLDSTDKIDYESKFINYDLGKTTGTSISKDSFLLFGNNKNKKNEITKINLSKNPNICINIEEKERTPEEMEKLAKEYINMSKFWENKDEYYRSNLNQTNTITTVINDNNFNDDTIFTDKNKNI